MNKEMQLKISNIICDCRGCGECKIYEYRRKHGPCRCEAVPLQFQLKYAKELLLSGDEKIIDAIEYRSDNSYYRDAIALIRSGGVQYD